MKRLDYLDELESRSIYIIREAYKQFKDVAMLWSVGKDSTALLWLVRKAFFGKIPFPVIHIDTGYKFPKMYEFRDKYAKEWGLNLIVGKNEEAIKGGMCPGKGRLQCCTELKTNALKLTISKHNLKALLLGIRRDEHGIRAKERYFSPRNVEFKWNYKDQPPELWDQFKTKSDDQTHIRVHPLLHWTELDIWLYVKREGMPVTDLYFAKNGKRYRSIGCVPCCRPIDSNASTIDEIIEELKTTTVSERSGRAQDKEKAYMMQKLRSLGYM
ncbi:MAG: sulfate adenylyltransferase subunit CysD [Candidatus Hydrothermarchaeaceae archaeon]